MITQMKNISIISIILVSVVVLLRAD